MNGYVSVPVSSNFHAWFFDAHRFQKATDSKNFESVSRTQCITSKQMLLGFSLHVLPFYCHFRPCTLFHVDQSSSTSGWLWGHHQLFPFWQVLLALLWLVALRRICPLFFGDICCCGTLWPYLPFPQNSGTNVRGTNVLEVDMLVKVLLLTFLT